jgi:hypothetical protein
MASGRPLNYSTTIPAGQTVSECQSILAAAGADSVAVHFEAGRPSGLSFTLKTPHGVREFTLPVDVPAMHAVLRTTDFSSLKASRARLVRLAGREHAANVAWRVIKDWLEANLALIAAQMAPIDEVMLPYLHVDQDRTLYQAYRERESALELTPGDGRDGQAATGVHRSEQESSR